MGHAPSYGSRSERAGSDQLQLPSRGTTVRVWPLLAHLRRLTQGGEREWSGPGSAAVGGWTHFGHHTNRTEF